MTKQRIDPYPQGRLPTKKMRAEADVGKMRDGYMVPAELRGGKMTPEQIAAEIAKFSPKPPGRT